MQTVREEILKVRCQYSRTSKQTNTNPIDLQAEGLFCDLQ